MTDSTTKSQSTAPVAWITGAAAGIGRACAYRLVGEGYRVALTDRDPDRLAETAREIREAGGEVLTTTLDITDAPACDDTVRQIRSAWGRLDTLVANAGVQIGGTLTDTAPEDWQRILEVNLNGTAYCARSALPALLDQDRGSIVFVSSVNALVGTTGMTLYDMSKAAVLGLTRSLAAEYGESGIRVNAVCPGNTLTDFHLDAMAAKGVTAGEIRDMTRGYGLLGRIAEPPEIAAAIAFLAGPDASFVTGQVLAVDGGYSVKGADA
ncbi:SDR family NAD(P)-dependent oxidoreductase [Elongatibacter sediminis]|uniref:SDR family oxidoreductase n=1 Tax=Elongatibacter sediminis TaxID=3119006 RepID=A0AAW9R6A4_9GAMM